jgi:hypothetical protein
MDMRVTFRTNSDQVLFLIATRLAAESLVVHLETLPSTTDLASPAVASQHLSV